MNHDRFLLTAIFTIIAFGIPAVANYYPLQTYAVMEAFGNAGGRLAAVILAHDPKTVPELQATYDSAVASARPAERKVRVLIVPGHEPDYGGAEYRSESGIIRERDLNVELAASLSDFLRADQHYLVFTTRDTRAWAPAFASYFNSQLHDIIAWKDAHKAEIANMIRIGQFTPISPTIFHNDIPDAPAIRLYGIDKWADDNNMDIVIHVHFNDYPRNYASEPGKYTGFAIYIPEKQFDNSTTTRALAAAVFARLQKYNPVSDLPGEQSGVVEDQDLIAIGAFNSVNAPSMLVEYSYIYESQIVNPRVRSTFLKELAYETYQGIKDFLDPGIANQSMDTLILPHQWDVPIRGTNDSPEDVFALQTALIADGEYPPRGQSLNDCPRTGRVGSCTKAALQAFQNKYGITGEKGIAGPKTLNRLNGLFSVQPL